MNPSDLVPDIYADFVFDVNGFIGTSDTVLPMTAAYYLKHGYKERKLNMKLIDELSNKIHTVMEDD